MRLSVNQYHKCVIVIFRFKKYIRQLAYLQVREINWIGNGTFKTLKYIPIKYYRILKSLTNINLIIIKYSIFQYNQMLSLTYIYIYICLMIDVFGMQLIEEHEYSCSSDRQNKRAFQKKRNRIINYIAQLKKKTHPSNKCYLNSEKNSNGKKCLLSN